MLNCRQQMWVCRIKLKIAEGLEQIAIGAIKTRNHFTFPQTHTQHTQH